MRKKEMFQHYFVFRFRLTFLTQLAKKIMQPSETTISGVERASSVYFQ